MRCITCRYALGGVLTVICPECGRAFDPGDTSTVDHSTRSLFVSYRVLRVAVVALTSIALLHLALGWLCWGIAALVLHHTPQATDRYSSISQISVLRSIWVIAGVCGPPLVILALCGIGMLMTEPDPSQGGKPHRRTAMVA